MDLNIFNGSISEFNELIGINTADISSSQNEINISFFPNPVQDQIHFNNPLNTIERLTVTNGNGEIQMIEMIANNRIDVSRLAPGLYFINVLMSDKHYQITRFLKM